MICTSTHVIFTENLKRDKILFKLKYEDILYIMGKQDELKIGMIVRKKMSPQTTFDCKTEFLAKEGGARLIAEDILTYCQIYILENSAVSHEYCDFIRKNVIDGLFEND